VDVDALEAVGVSKRYGVRDVLCGVDLVARSGRLHGLLGPNGAGKTTLLRILLGLVRHDAGTIRILGRPVDPMVQPVPDGVAGFRETPALHPSLSAPPTPPPAARPAAAPHAGPADRTQRALDEVGLAAQADAAVSGYSAGMRQRLGPAAALLRSPRLLFLDEP